MGIVLIGFATGYGANGELFENTPTVSLTNVC